MDVFGVLMFFLFRELQDDELTILDVRKFKPIHKRKFNYEVKFHRHGFSYDLYIACSLEA